MHYFLIFYLVLSIAALRSERPCTLPNSVIVKKREHTSAPVALLLPKEEAKRKGKGKPRVEAAVLNVALAIAMERVKMVMMLMLV